MTFIRVQPDGEEAVDILPAGSNVSLAEDPDNLVALAVARLRARNKTSPSRAQSAAITHLDEARHWLRDLAETEGSAK